MLNQTILYFLQESAYGHCLISEGLLNFFLEKDRHDNVGVQKTVIKYRNWIAK
jgi:hypothetical protein